MAAFIRHGLPNIRAMQEICLITKRINITILSNRTYAQKIKPNPRIKPNFGLTQGAKIKSTGESLAAKGFLRSQKEYNPPSDAADRLMGICKRVVGNLTPTSPIGDSEARFALFNECFQEFQHGIPNSLLYTMETLGDVIEFYETPVSTTVPLDAMKNIDLPPNLHIEYDYHRFHPETDTMFDGVTAFTKSSTLVTGLKYKNKYRGHTAKTSWP